MYETVTDGDYDVTFCSMEMIFNAGTADQIGGIIGRVSDIHYGLKLLAEYDNISLVTNYDF